METEDNLYSLSRKMLFESLLYRCFPGDYSQPLRTDFCWINVLLSRTASGEKHNLMVECVCEREKKRNITIESNSSLYCSQ